MLHDRVRSDRSFLSLQTGWAQIAPYWKVAAFYILSRNQRANKIRHPSYGAESRWPIRLLLTRRAERMSNSGCYEVVLTRPADPIQHLAHCLLKYRRLHPLEKELSPREHFRSVLPGPEELGEAEEPDYSPANNVFVHMSYMAVLHSIGDIFDDDDIT
ncbi:uncharacterized protein LOC124280194 [Haliotis rubra]|uniref:uncharacterized protein LOC124280194 n=1 Tax=Haliotis rubra TaxID=36100 RepID=UPI001EE526F9|nr:uncharacterized protein LOC124280194 [Haliotis rubra]